MIWIVIVLILSGLLLLLLEVLVIPGTGLSGIVGFLFIIGGIWLAYANLGSVTGHYVLGGTLLVNIITIWLAFRYKTWKRLMLNEQIDSKVNTLDDLHIKVGDEGITISRCAPVGKAEINGHFVEVDARTEFVDEGTPVKVTKIEKNKIFIKPLKLEHHE